MWEFTAIYLRQGVQTQGLMVPTFEHWSHPRKHNQSDFKVHNLFPVCPHECDAGVQCSRTNPKKNIHKVFACIHTGSLVRTNKSYKIILHTVPYFFWFRKKQEWEWKWHWVGLAWHCVMVHMWQCIVGKRCKESLGDKKLTTVRWILWPRSTALIRGNIRHPPHGYPNMETHAGFH